MSSVESFLRRMQWRPAGSSVPEPVVALLGPRGAGKSTALSELSMECRSTIVHASLDFAKHPDLDPVSAVAFVAFSLMRDWFNVSPRPRFHRVALSLLALNERLDRDNIVARKQIKKLIQQYLQRQPVVSVGEKVTEPFLVATQLAAMVSGIVPKAFAVTAREEIKPGIAALLRGAARWETRDAMRWHRRIPEAEDASIVDWLTKLSVERSNILTHVMNALLADIEDFNRHHPARKATCDCVIPDGLSGRHGHVWVLMLDNVRTATGELFLEALLRAKQERAGAPDPLLVVAAVDRWNPAWRKWWREPWQTALAEPRKPSIPLFSAPDRADWARHHDSSAGPGTDPASGWYPVWLDPTPVTDVLRVPASDVELVSRLASGHPKAMLDLQAQLDAPTDGEAPVSILDATDEAGVPLWQRAVEDCVPGLLPEDRPWPAAPPATVVAALLSEPGRPGDNMPADRFPGTTQALRQLRTNLWVSTFAARPSPLWPVGHEGQEHPAVLHPWLSRCLLAGLAAEWDNIGEGPFAAVPSGDGDPGRALFRELAQDRFAAVVKRLVDLYNTIDHRAWIRVLDDATSAPCRLPHSEPFGVSYRRLVPDYVAGRTPTEAAVASITALLWLCRDPLTMPGPLHGTPWRAHIKSEFGKLVNESVRDDEGALGEAASQFHS